MYKIKENLRRCSKCGSSPAMDPTIAIFRFPKPGKTNTLRCESWAQYCFPDGEWFSQEFQLKLHNEHKVLCNKHFNRTSFSDYPTSSKKLHRFSVPEDINEVEPQPGVQHTNCIVSRRETAAGSRCKKPSKRKTVVEKQTRASSPYLGFVRGSAAGGSKRKATSPPPDYLSTKRSNRTDIFNILQSEEASSNKSKRCDEGVTSSFSSRVLTGTSRRVLKTSGDYFVDLKIYKTPDYVNNAADVRYKKALVTVKLQCDESSSPWESLQGFLGGAWALFEESGTVHYSN